MKPFTHLKTQNLLLRALVTKDRRAIFILRNHLVVSGFVKRDIWTSEREASKFIQKITKDINDGNIFYWAICLQDSPQLIGAVCLWNFSADRKIGELGYELLPSYQGRGHMPETIRAVIDFGFKECALEQIEAYTHKDNLRSKRLLMKFGFQHLPDRIDPKNENNEVYALKTKEQSGVFI